MPFKPCWTSVRFNYDRAKTTEIYAKNSSGFTSHSPENSVPGTERHTYGKSLPFVNPVNLLIYSYDPGTLHYL